jgi:hypothetical protein
LNYVEKAKQWLRHRASAYRATFNTEERDTQVVLADLAKFCRADRSTFHPDPHVAARLDGRREVWLRLTQHLNLTTDQLYALYGAPSNQQKE